MYMKTSLTLSNKVLTHVNTIKSLFLNNNNNNIIIEVTCPFDTRILEAETEKIIAVCYSPYSFRKSDKEA